MSEQSSPDIKKHSSLRKVAKRIAPLLIAAVAAFSSNVEAPPPISITPPPISQEQGQLEIEKNSFRPRVTIIDAGPTEPTAGIIQKEFPSSNDDLVKKLLGDTYISRQQLTEEFGGDFENKMGEVTNKYPQALLYKFFDTYFSHGQEVAQTMERTFGKLGLKSTGIDLVPLQNVFAKEDIKFVTDSLGNLGVSINFDPQKIIELLRNDQNRIVNMSFQVGDVNIFLEKKYRSVPQPENIYSGNSVQSDDKGNIYIGAVGYAVNKDGITINVDVQGKEVGPTTPDEQKILRQQKLEEANQKAIIKETKSPLTKIVGAYDQDKARENLPKLFAVANAYPDKLFFAASGNEGEDFEEILRELKGQKPKNLLIIGQWTGNYGPTHKVVGADIYVNNEELGLGYGSSLSTAALSAYAETLLRQGLSQEEVLERIKTNSHQENYNFDLPDVTKKGSEMVFEPPF